jgi:hypothetical protein
MSAIAVNKVNFIIIVNSGGTNKRLIQRYTPNSCNKHGNKNL